MHDTFLIAKQDLFEPLVVGKLFASSSDKVKYVLGL